MHYLLNFPKMTFSLSVSEFFCYKLKHQGPVNTVLSTQEDKRSLNFRYQVSQISGATMCHCLSQILRAVHKFTSGSLNQSCHIFVLTLVELSDEINSLYILNLFLVEHIACQ